MTAEFDKLDNHYHLQLSALMDGALAPDQARFLLRRLQHDEELTGCWERWQLLGDVLRGQAQAPAPADFASRVAQVLASEPAPGAGAAAATAATGRNRVARWGGGALAASFALLALFMARQQLTDESAPAPTPAVATQLPGDNETVAALAAAPSAASTAGDAATSVAAATVAVASVPRRQDSATRGSATRNQQAARSAAARVNREPLRAVAAASEPAAALVAAAPATAVAAPQIGNRIDNPFVAAPANSVPPSRPWPRSALPQYSAGGFTAGLSSEQTTRTFYPFEPRLPASPPLTSPEPDNAQD